MGSDVSGEPAFSILICSSEIWLLCELGRWVPMFRKNLLPARCSSETLVDCIWNVMAHAQKSDFVFRRNGRVHLNRWGRQFSGLLAGELYTSACRVCTARANLCSAVIWRLLVTHSILLFSLHFPSRASPCAITFQLDSTYLTTRRRIPKTNPNAYCRLNYPVWHTTRLTPSWPSQQVHRLPLYCGPHHYWACSKALQNKLSHGDLSLRTSWRRMV
jgi:hypothetical protein